MTGSRHVLLAADGAEQFADEVGVERAAPDYFRTARRIESWQRARDAWRASGSGSEEQLGTVGCVALDVAGNLAAATSTGGLTLKRFGRIGDSPLIGAGNYADNTCAVSGTGQGEEFIRHVVAYDVAARMRYGGATLTAAVQAIVGEVLKPGDGGLIAVARDGELVMAFNTEGMYRAAADSRGRFEVGLGREAAR